MMIKTVAALLVFSGYACGAVDERNPSADFHGSASTPAANVSLPPHVLAPDGELTLFADFEHLKEGTVPLYVVNRTTEKAVMAAQDGDLYIKMERQKPDGTWQRAQAHESSGCGNSYGSRPLMPGQHLMIMGYRPKTGEKGKVRYACYGIQSLKSNVGEGLYLIADVEAAQNDNIARRHVPRVLERTISREARPEFDVGALSHRVAVLRLLRTLGGVPFAHTACLELASILDDLPEASPLEKAAAQALHSLLSEPWPEQRDSRRLFEAAREALDKAQGDAQGFGPSVQDADMLWSVIAQLGDEDPTLGQPNEAPWRAIWKPVLEKALETAKAGSTPQQETVCRLLALPSLVDEILPDAAWEPLLLSPHNKVCLIAANTLSRRGRWERLADLGWKLESNPQLIVLGVLAHNPVPDQPKEWDSFGGVLRYPPDESIEKKFWEHCLKTQPLLAAAKLQGHATKEERFPDWVYAPIRNYWHNQVEQSKSKASEFEVKEERRLVEASLEFLAGAKDSDDDALLQSLIDFRGFHRTDTSGPFGGPEDHFYAVRERVQRLLKQRRESSSHFKPLPKVE